MERAWRPGGYEIIAPTVFPPRMMVFAKMLSILPGVLLAGCNLLLPPSSPAYPPPVKAESPTPKISTPTTPFSGGSLWISSGLEEPFTQAWMEPVLLDTGYSLVEDEAQAQIRIAPRAGTTVSTWFYVLVAPFPTTTDDMGWEELKDRWSGVDVAEPLLVSERTYQLLSQEWGAAGLNVRSAPAGELLEMAWANRPSFAIVPFEALEPSWKVISIDGQSPIRKGFEIDIYPLKFEIGVAGPQGSPEWITKLIEIPSSNFDPHQMTVLAMTGVTAMTRATAWQMERRGVGFPAEKIGQWLVEADLTHISNEVAFTSACPRPDPEQAGLKFCSAPEYIELLELIGTDIIELTGNHVRDYGSDALEFTLSEYRSRGWGTFGGGVDLAAAHQPLLIEHNGNHLAFMGCNYAGPKYAWAGEDLPGSAPCDMEKLLHQVSQLVGEGHVVIFTFQWAERGTVLEDQREAFEAVVEAGARIVSGSQAHQPLGFALSPDGFIHFGLGNLFFDQMQTLDLRSEFIDRHVFYNGRHISTELLTAMLESYAQPRPMTEVERAGMLEKVFELSGW